MEKGFGVYNLFEDEDDLFQGSPKSKFLDIVYNASRDLASLELVALVERIATLELMLEEQLGREIEEHELKGYAFEHSAQVDALSKNIYIHSVANVLTQNE